MYYHNKGKLYPSANNQSSNAILSGREEIKQLIEKGCQFLFETEKDITKKILVPQKDHLLMRPTYVYSYNSESNKLKFFKLFSSRAQVVQEIGCSESNLMRCLKLELAYKNKYFFSKTSLSKEELNLKEEYLEMHKLNTRIKKKFCLFIYITVDKDIVDQGKTENNLELFKKCETIKEAKLAVGADYRTVKNYMDTGKLYKGLYIFTSTPLI